MKPLDRLRHLRAGGYVRRFHTCPTISPQTVGEHSHQMAVLLKLLKPDYSRELMEAVLLHDLPERHTGDCPRFAKNEAFREKEAEVARILEIDIELSPEDEKWLGWLDALELVMWCLDQRAMGNLMVDHIIKKVSQYLFDQEDLPKSVRQALMGYDAAALLPIGA